MRRIASGKLATYAVFNGRFRSFGPADDPTSRTRYAQAKAAWEANGRRLVVPTLNAAPATIEDLTNAFLVHAETYYRRKDGKATGTIWRFRQALGWLLKLRSVRQTLLDAKEQKRKKKGKPRPPPDPNAPPRYARRTINALVGRIVHVFRWGGR